MEGNKFLASNCLFWRTKVVHCSHIYKYWWESC